jgi:polysaccharide biosynthesis/export protein
MLRIARTAAFVALSVWCMPVRAETAAVPKDLLQYVKNARELGLQDDQVRQAAVNAGWKAPLVDATLAATRRTDLKTAGPPPPDVNPDEYQIGPGDVLQVMVWKEPEASVPSVVVRPDGKIAMPLLKEIGVAGMTPHQAEEAINEKITEFIPGADVTVVVARIDSKKIYVVGAVKKEGSMPLAYRMSVLQALSEAGGLTDYARRQKIYVLRMADGKQYRYPFNYDQVIKGEQSEQNIWVQPGDTIVVPK